jgi:hypothetical protein
MLGFQAIASAARAGGVDDAQAFLDAFHAIFRLAGIVAAATGMLVAWSARRRALE